MAAVIDKDFAASLLATQIDAGLLLIATSVDYVSLNYGADNEHRISEASLDELKAYVADGSHFGKGSMAPKIAAVVHFLENGGRDAIITSPDCVSKALKGNAGTRFYR